MSIFRKDSFIEAGFVKFNGTVKVDALFSAFDIKIHFLITYISLVTDTSLVTPIDNNTCRCYLTGLDK